MIHPSDRTVFAIIATIIGFALGGFGFGLLKLVTMRSCTCDGPGGNRVCWTCPIHGDQAR